MFLRFTVGEVDVESQWCKGLFTASYELRDNGLLTPQETTQLQQILDWFKENLPIPSCFGRAEHRRAICWFTANAGEPLTKIWKLASFLQEQGMGVFLHKTRDPGRRVYSDRQQVVAIPQRNQRVRRF